ncbi:MAG: signal peptidase II [Aurantibacter sp.]
MIKRLIIIALVLMNIGCDQLSKGAVRKNVDPNEYIEVVSNNLILTNVENTGAMLGFGQNLPPILKIIFLQVIPVMVLLVLLYRILRKRDLDKWVVMAFAFVIGGGIGNLIDRVAHGSVTDFFVIELGFFKTGIFNMADVSVTTGVLMILFLSLKSKKLAL